MNEPKSYHAIMLSSTFTDLKDHRQRAIEIVSRFGCMPRVMEHSGAQAEADVIEASLNMVRDAVAYVGIVSLKYGQTPFDINLNPDELSITELEFNEALRLKRPIVLFIMSVEHLVRIADIESDPRRLEKLNRFRERSKLMRGEGQVQRVYEMFDSLEQFSINAAVAIGNLVRYLERTALPETVSVGQTPPRTISNIPINIPFRFLGRDHELAEIDRALGDGRAAIVVLYGLRGVGKTTLAAAYAERHRGNFRAVWWIRAENESTMRADLVGLGAQLGWVASDAAQEEVVSEEEAVSAVLKRLPLEGKDILLIYDNAIGPTELVQWLPRGGGPRVVVTSNATSWGALAAAIQIKGWSSDVGADYLMARTGRATEREASLTLSVLLGGLPLAHEQAAAFCERTGMPLAEYRKRFEAAPSNLLNNSLDAVQAYHQGLTVETTFAFAINEAARRHPAAEPLIIYASLLAPEPIPLYLFSKGREKFSEPFRSLIEGPGLDEAVAALRAFALVDRESIPDERDASIATDCIRLHRLVRLVGASRHELGTKTAMLRELIEAMALVYPVGVHRDHAAWPQARRLDALAMALVANSASLPSGSEVAAANLLDGLEGYRDGALASYSEARELAERALALRESVLGPSHPDTAKSLTSLGYLLSELDDLPGAQAFFERALSINELVSGPEHIETATSLSNLSTLHYRRKNYAEAQRYCEVALAIREKALPPDDPAIATNLDNLSSFLQAQGELERARPYSERALAIYEKKLAPNHLETATCLNNFSRLLRAQGHLAQARSFAERALGIFEVANGPKHPDTVRVASNTASLLDELGCGEEAKELRSRFHISN